MLSEEVYKCFDFLGIPKNNSHVKMIIKKFHKKCLKKR